MMWPYLLDMTKDESMQHLRCLEIDAFSALVTALRAQGHLDREKLKLLKETGIMLGITKERYKAEIRRVVNDERLNTIAYHVTGERYNAEDWADEGQRLIPLIPRVAPQTLYSAIADDVADSTIRINRSLPLPASTERKRIAVSPPTYPASTSDLINKVQFRTAEPDCKKRKISMGMENSSHAQHLMAPPKISKIQQIYRQRSKNRLNEQFGKLKQQDSEKLEFMHHHMVQRSNQQLPPHPMQQQVRPKLMVNPAAVAFITPKINIIQNINTTTFALPPGHVTSSSMVGGPIISGFEQNLRPQTAIVKYPYPTTPISMPTAIPIARPQQSLANINAKTITASIKTQVEIVKPKEEMDSVKQQPFSQASSHLVITKENCQPNNNSVDSPEVKSSLTISSKTITTDGQQKVIVSMVSSNHLVTTPSSILQRTLTTLPFKNIPIKSIDKFKLVTANSSNHQQVGISNANFYPNYANQKVVAVRNANNKKIIPLSQVQVVNTKDGIKVFPLGGKIITSNNNSNYYITNTNVNDEATMSTSSTQMVMCTKEEKSRVTELPATPVVVPSVNHVPSEIACTEGDKVLHENTETYERGNEEKIETNITNNNAQNVEQHAEELYCGETLCMQDGGEDQLVDCEQVDRRIQHGEARMEQDGEARIEQDGEGDVEKLSNNGISYNRDEFEIISIPVPTEDVPIDNHNEFSSHRHNDNDYCSGMDIIGNEHENNHEAFLEHVIEDIIDNQANTCEDKVDSALYIYDNDNTTEEVIIDGIENQHMEILNNVCNVHEESFPKVNNITS